MTGVPKHKVTLEPHNDGWAAEFEETKQLLCRIHGDNVADVQHVGSTAIPGIVAKPMLDVALLLHAITGETFTAMAEAGYTYYGEVAPGKHLFILRGPDQRSLQHIHCYGEQAPELFYEQLRFRDFLLSHPDYAREYEQLKQSLCAQYADDRQKYTASKQAFFDKIKALAAQT